MLLKPLPSKPTFLTRALRAGIAGLGAIAAMAATSSGCLDRPVAPATPNTSNVFIDAITQTAVDKIDLVLGIDNSLSMADKQEILGLAVPLLVQRLVEPFCVSDQDPDNKQPSSGGSCPGGFTQEFKPINNIHIGIVTSSIGGHGADSCSPEEGSTYTAMKNDMAHLLGSVRQGIASHGPVPGFLAWNPAGVLSYGDNNAAALIQNVTAHVRAAAEQGCGFEAQLESWYRFLIDPEPPGAVIRDPSNPNFAVVQGIDDTILTQRTAFLRPDSLVAIIMLTDENDCSTQDGGVYWLPGQSVFGGVEFRLPRSTAQCLSDPNHACCRSCGLDESGGAPPGCASQGSDPECQKGNYDKLSDQLNLRCFDQKRRYGLDFLHPVMRYVTGLTQITVANRLGESVPNPLYSDLQQGTAIARDVSLVFLAGIIGVPWQDLATADTLNNPARLKYLSSKELRAPGLDRWDMILGTWPDGRPSDSLMWESVDDRTRLQPPGGPNPVTGDALVPASGGGTNPINGHEYDSPDRIDLQYACIFPKTPTECGVTPPPPGCDCTDASNKPLCQGTRQTHAKAYPGLRELQVLKLMGESAGGVDNAIVASICPKITDQSNPDFGYNPAVAAIIDRLKEALQGRCLPRQLIVDPDTGIVPCAVVEATFSPDGTCGPCTSQPGREELIGDKTALVRPVRSQLSRLGNCGGRTDKPCENFCLCEILPSGGQVTDQETGGVEITDPAALNTCQTSPATSTFTGYCYVDEAQQIPADAAARQAILAKCPATQKRILRFSDNTPTKGSIAFIACLGSPVPDTATP